MIKKFFAIAVLLAVFALASPAAAKAEAVSLETISYLKAEESLKTPKGKEYMSFSVCMPQLPGDTPAVQKINQYFQKEFNKWKKRMKKEVSAYRKDKPFQWKKAPCCTWYVNYIYSASGEGWVSFLAEHYIFANGPRYYMENWGATFNTETEERLSLQQVIGGSKKQVRRALMNQLKKKAAWKWSGFYGGRPEARMAVKQDVTSKDVFYIKGKYVYVVHSMYELSRDKLVLKVEHHLE